ncbi:endolytic transglycosylase MltG [Methylocella sp.]|uniref:endolytic transglycosylase MltG n=1 Tax=Methylocella sp. TaxID=1978226 RepID=UPI0037840D7F
MAAPPPNSSDPTQRQAPQAGRPAYRAGPQSPNEALQPEVAPPPPPVPPSRRRPIMSAVSGFLSFLLIVALAGVLGVVWSEQRIKAPGPLAADKVLYIVPGTDLPEIIGELDRQGVIDSPFLFNVALLVEGKRSKVKAGEYLFKQGASLREVMDTLVSGKQVLHAITIPEGLTSLQIVERLLESDVLTGEVRETPKEGSLMPDTYKVTRGWSRGDLLKKMQDDQKKAVDQIWAKRTSNLPLHSPYEMVILASIVEKETGKADERPRVASVFMNRLSKRMRLQSDPTIVYGLVGGKGTLGRGITRSELERPTPYNTYTIDGLPPGPIANPGRAALEAVANPSRTQDLYFVADGTGGHVFSETLGQHSRNVQRWRQIERDSKDKAGATPDDEQAAPAAPAGRAAPKPDQRGAKGGGSIYGALPERSTQAAAAPSEFERAFSVVGDPLSLNAPWSANLRLATKSRTGKRGHDGGFAGAETGLALGPGLDELGLTLRGAPAEAVLDGSDEAAPAETLAARDRTAPDPFGAARRGVAPASPAPADSDAPGVVSDRADPEIALNAALAAAPETPAPVEPRSAQTARVEPALDLSLPAQAEGGALRPKIYDVSEGTALDPLKDKTYDLNYAKTVPTAKQMMLPN